MAGIGLYAPVASRAKLPMRTKVKDRIVSVVLILLFLGAIAGSAYFIIKVMTRWHAPGLG